MSDITVKHLEHDGTVLNTFSPENLSFTLNKGENGTHDISYEISRDNVSTDFVGAYRTDFELYVDSTTRLMAGMHTEAPRVTTDEENVQIAGKDWLHYLERRFWPYDDTDPDASRVAVGGGAATIFDPPVGFSYYVAPDLPRDSALIIKDILDHVLAQPNSLEITYSLSAMGYNQAFFSISLPDTENILSKIQTLSQEDEGQFDFYITPDKVFHLVHPYQYDIGVVDDNSLAEWTFDAGTPSSGLFQLDYGNTGPIATKVLGTGAINSSDLIVTREYVPGSEQFRLLESTVSFGTTLYNARLQALTRRTLLFGLNPVHELTLSVIPESITNFWTRFRPGKAIWVIGDLEAHLVNAAFEIVSIDGTSDNDGNLVASFKLNQIYTPAEL